MKTIDVGQPGEYPYVHALAMWNAIEYLLSPAKELKFRDKETQKSEHTTIGKNYEIFQSVRADAPLIVDLTLGSVSMMIALYDMMPANAMFLHWRKTMDGRRAVPSKTFPENWTREDVRSLLAQLTLDKETT